MDNSSRFSEPVLQQLKLKGTLSMSAEERKRAHQEFLKRLAAVPRGDQEAAERAGRAFRGEL